MLLDYPKIGGDDVIEDYAKKAIRNLLHANIDVHNRIFISEFPKDGINCIEKLQSQTWLFLVQVDMTESFNKSHIKEGNLQSITLKDSIIHVLYQFQ